MPHNKKNQTQSSFQKDLEERILKLEVGALPGVFDMNGPEYVAFITDFMKRAIIEVSKGNSLAITNPQGEILGSCHIPIYREELFEQEELPFSLKNLVGLVVNEKHRRYMQICKINSHSPGIYDVSFSNKFTTQFSDEIKEDSNLKVFLRKHFYVNSPTYLTFGDLILEFLSLEENKPALFNYFHKLKSDYKTLFKEDLPDLNPKKLPTRYKEKFLEIAPNTKF